MEDPEYCVDPKCAIDWLQEANQKTGKPNVIKYKLISGTRFYYVEEYSAD